MKKYDESSIKGLTKAQVLEKLAEEGATGYDPSMKKEELVSTLLSLEVEAETVSTKSPVESPSEAILEAEKKLEEMSKGSADHKVFMAALEARKTGTAKTSFARELARRAGKLVNKRTFQDELNARIARKK